MYTSLHGPTVVTRRIRPPRVACIVNTIQQCEEFIQLCSLTWGGKQFCVVPYDATTGLSEEWKRLITAYDPDAIVTGYPLDETTDHFLAALIHEPASKAENAAPRIPVTRFQLVGNVPFGQSLQAALLGQDALKHYDYQYPALIPDVPPDHPLRLFITARYGELNQNAVMTISAQLGLGHTMSLDLFLPLLRLPMADDFVEFMRRGEHAHYTFLLRNQDQRLPSDITSTPRHGLSLLEHSLAGLTQHLPDRPRWKEEPDVAFSAHYLLIASDGISIEDFCWFWNLRAQRYLPQTSQVVWLPADVIEQRASEVATLFPAGEPLVLLSKSVPAEQLHVLARALGSNVGVETEQLDRFYTRQFVVGIPDQQEVVFERGRTRIPVPRVDEVKYCHHPRYFYTDIEIEEIQLPRLNVAYWGYHDVVQMLYRVSRTGLSFRCDAHDTEGAAYLRLALPTAWQMVETFANQAGYTVEMSDKGNIANQFLRLVGGWDYSWILSGSTVHALLDALSELDQANEFRRRLRDSIRPVLTTMGTEGEGDRMDTVVKKIMQEMATDRHERIYQTVGAMKSALKFKGATVVPAFVQWLVHQRILFRGEEMHCPICNTKQWRYVDTINTQMQCAGCQQVVDTPLHVERTEWKYRLNALAARAYSAGVVPHVLTLSYYINVIHPMSWLHETITGAFPGILLKAQEGKMVPFQQKEVDGAWIDHGELSIGECKTHSAELSAQEVRDYITLAPVLKCKRIVFAVLDDGTQLSSEVRDLVRQSPVPVEILTTEHLFNQYVDKAEHLSHDNGSTRSPQQDFERAVKMFLDSVKERRRAE